MQTRDGNFGHFVYFVLFFIIFFYCIKQTSHNDQLFHFPCCLLEASKPRNMKILHRTISFIALLSTSCPLSWGIYAFAKPCVSAYRRTQVVMSSHLHSWTLGLPGGWHHVLKIKSLFTHDCSTKHSSGRIITMDEKHTPWERRWLENRTPSQNSRSLSASSHSMVSEEEWDEYLFWGCHSSALTSGKV